MLGAFLTESELGNKAEKSKRELYKLAKKVRNTHYDIVIDVYRNFK